VQDLFIEVGNNEKLHVLKGTGKSQETVFLLVHGASRHHQSSEHWRPHFHTFLELGSFYAIDMLGHGNSVKNTSTSAPVTANRQVECIIKLLNHEKLLSSSNAAKWLIPVGRSYGGAIVCQLMEHEEVSNVTQKAVLIAPVSATCKHSEIPVLCVWGRDDTIIKFNPRRVTDVFKNVTTLFFDQVQSHMPEIVKEKEFQEALVNFCKN